MQRLIKIIISLTVLITARGISFAVPSKDGRFPGPKDAVRPREVVQVYDEKLKAMRAIRISGRAIRAAVIPVQFTSAGTQSSGSYAITGQNLLDLAANLTYLQNYYNEAGYGTIVTTFTVIFNGSQETIQQITGSEACFTLNNSMSYYANTPTSVGYLPDGSGGGQFELIEDAVTAATASSVNVSSGSFDTVIVVHAGYGNESTAGGSQKDPANPGDIWSVQVDFGGPDPRANGFVYGIVVPMMEAGGSPQGVCCHEFGHFLGLPDMYNTNSGNLVVGDWCLMDNGCWLNNGYSPGHPCVWCKNYLGIVSPQVISSSQQVSAMAPVETSSSSVCRFNVHNNENEYFLVCFTTISAYNPYDPGTGVLIWHVDEATINGETFAQRISNNDINCYTPLTAALVTANGAKIGESYTGGRSDPWPGLKKTFTFPDSNAYNGRASGITLSDFRLSSTAAGFYANIDLNPANWLGLTSSPRVYPNPFKPSIHHDGITFVNLAAGARIKIFNITGELVQSGLADSGGTGRINWNGVNDSGRMLASGIYIAHIDGAAGATNLKIAIEK